MLQYLAQGACMALEDAVTLGEALRAARRRLRPRVRSATSARASRAPRASCCRRARWAASTTPSGVERLVRNDLWKGRTPERFYDALEWLYGWRVENCLAA